MTWKTLDDMDLAGKTVLIRVDINVPVKDGVVTQLNIDPPGAFGKTSAEEMLKSL